MPQPSNPDPATPLPKEAQPGHVARPFPSDQVSRDSLRPAARGASKRRAPGRLGSPCGQHMELSRWPGMGAPG